MNRSAQLRSLRPSRKPVGIAENLLFQVVEKAIQHHTAVFAVGQQQNQLRAAPALSDPTSGAWELVIPAEYEFDFIGCLWRYFQICRRGRLRPQQLIQTVTYDRAGPLLRVKLTAMMPDPAKMMAELGYLSSVVRKELPLGSL